MALKPSYKTKDEIPEALRSDYVERGGEWLLQVDGMVAATAFENMKEAMGKRLTDAIEKFERSSGSGMNRDDILAAVTAAAKQVAGGGSGDESPELADLTRRIAAVEGDKTKAEGERDSAKASLAGHVLDGQLQAGALAAGVDPTRVAAALTLAGKHFELDKGLKAKTALHSPFGPDVEVADFFEKAKTDAGFSFLWPPSKGGGSDNGGGGGGSGGPNPFGRKGWNLTEQGKLIATDRGKAEQLATAAGTTIGGARPPAEEQASA